MRRALSALCLVFASSPVIAGAESDVTARIEAAVVGRAYPHVLDTGEVTEEVRAIAYDAALRAFRIEVVQSREGERRLVALVPLDAVSLGDASLTDADTPDALAFLCEEDMACIEVEVGAEAERVREIWRSFSIGCAPQVCVTVRADVETLQALLLEP